VDRLPGEFEVETMPHVRSLLRVARRLTGNPASAEDLVQETMLAAWRGFHRLMPDSNTRAWLFRILVNSFHAQGRRLNARPVEVPIAEGAETPAPRQADATDAIEMGRALGELSVEHRAVLLLGAVEGFTIYEISEILAVPAGTVMSRMSRAREALRARLGSGHKLTASAPKGSS